MTNALKYIDMSTYYKECFVEKIGHYDALEVWSELETGTKVSLEYDKNESVIKVNFDKNDEAKSLGILSEDDAKNIMPILKEGWTDIFFGRILFIGTEKENGKLKLVIYIASKEHKK